MIDLNRYQTAFSALANPVTEAEVNADKISKTVLHIQDGALADGQSGSVTKLYVRATAGQTGTAYTEKQDEAPADVLGRAMESASLASGAPLPMHRAHTELLGAPGQAGSIQDAVAFGLRSEALARENPSVESVVGCQVNLYSRESHTVNSHGLDVSSRSHWAESMLDVVMKRDGRYTPGYAYISAPSLAALDAGAFAAAAAADGDAYDGGGLSPYALPSGRHSAVLSGRVMRNILMTAWMALSGQAMLAGKSVFKHAQGTKIGADALTIVNAPSHPMIGQAWLLDSEGTALKPVKLVENGMLRTPLYTLFSGKAAGMPSTGSAGRVDRMTGTTPITMTTVPAVLYIEPGKRTQEALVESMGTGLLLTYSLDLYHSVNAVSGAFSIPCGGVYYQDGKAAGFVSQLTMAGNLKDLLSNIESVADDLDFDNFYLETYTVGSPSALVHDLSFSS
ncbi:MAG: TldD/PmbA family protein [Clostridiales bacterium]|nr:TldD/PmbA family protein [Clostridiales bacterium]